MRWLALLPALLFAVPAAAQDEPAWVGVWEGHVGTYPVNLCIDVWGDGPARGSYYYRTQNKPIALTEEDGEGGWIELAPGGEAGALWEFTEQTGERLRGTWRQGRRRLPFDLKPMAWTEGEWGGACSSIAFMAWRLGGGDVREEAADLEGWRYLRRTYLPPAHFTDVLSIESFSFTPERPGDEAINGVLAAYLPSETFDDEFVGCLGGAISVQGIDGYFERTIKPAMIAREFLAFDEALGTYCGGAHPSHYAVTHTFDRESGEEIDLFDWIGEPVLDGEDSVIADGLRELVFARWPADAAECAESAGYAEYWSLGLARDGIVFQPDLPHVATACEERTIVEWQALAPFLDAEGRAGLARLQGG